MRKMKSLMMMAAIAAASFTFTSCDDDPWDGPWHDDYGWYEDDNLLAEAQTLVGDWYGKVQLSELAEDGNSRNNYEFEANMIFYRDKNNANSLSGNGIEMDYATDDSGDTQTLKFTWYIDNNGDIYIKYASGTTFVMDAGANSNGYGFHLGEEKDHQNDTFYGYMIGTGTAKGNIMYIELERNSSSTARALSRSAAGSATATFGTNTVRTPIAGTIKKLPARR